MKSRASKFLNFIAFNLLFFSLYLNFIYKDVNSVEAQKIQQPVNKVELVENPENYLQKTVQSGADNKATAVNNAAIALVY